MLKLVVIDLTSANIDLFEAYERKVLPLLGQYGGQLKLGLRSTDGMTETHILYFPDVLSFDNFLSDPLRKALQAEWTLTGALSSVTNVNEIYY